MTLCHGSLKFLTSRGRGNFPHPCGKHMGAGTAARFERVSGPNLLSNDTRSLGQGPLAALAVVGGGDYQGGASLCPGLGSLSPLG